MKKLLAVAVLLLGTLATVTAQETWFCDKPGTKLTYVTVKGKKSKLAHQYVVKDVATEGNKTTITYEVILPKVDEPVQSSVWYADGNYHIDAQAAVGQFANGIELEGNAPVIPMDPKLNEAINDCSLSMKLGNLINSNVDYSNIKFTKHEEINVQGNTYDAWCLEFDTNSKVAFVKVAQHVEYWLAKGVGVVRQVTYHKNGKEASCVELQKVE